MADNSGAIDLGSLSEEQQEELDRITEERGDPNDPQHEGSQKRHALTAFLVIVEENGNPEVMAFEDPELVIQVKPTNDLIFGAVSTIAKDMQAQETAQASALATAQVMMQQAKAMAEQQQSAALAARLGNLHG